VLSIVQKAAYELIQSDARFLYSLVNIQKNAKNINSNYIMMSQLNILVREYRCSGGTDTANPAAGNRCSGTGIPHLLNCLLPASLLA